ncbi:MAG: ABC transporter permease [Nitrospinota bacterium]
MSLLETASIIGLLASTVRLFTPLIFASMGELLCERSGILNLGIEGTMLMGAVAAFLGAYTTGSLYLGLLIALLTGALLGVIMGFMTITLGASQHVSGLGIFFFGLGFSLFSYRVIVGSPKTLASIQPFSVVPIPGLSKIPVLGPILFSHHWLVYAGLLLAPAVHFFLFHTAAGLRLRTVGENPHAADAAGVNVYWTRYLALIAGGCLMALGGAYLSIAANSVFLDGMTDGRGWVSIALVVFGNWRPGKIMWGALLFGFIDALQLRLQAVGFQIPYQIFLLLPYLLTILVLIGVARKATYPAALLVPYKRGES